MRPLHACSSEALLATILRDVPRRYRLPELPAIDECTADPQNGANRLAFIIEHARRAGAAGREPDARLKQQFLHELDALVRSAVHAQEGDPVVQAMILRQQSEAVREYVGLMTQQPHDARRVSNVVNGVAHPAKLERLPASELREQLAQLQAHVAAARWDDAARVLQALSNAGGMNRTVVSGLARLREEGTLQRLQRLEALRRNDDVRQYQALLDRQGPPANSHEAAQNGAAGRERGMSVEALSRASLQALADRLNEAEGNDTAYRVVTSMYVPAALAANQEGGKTEWDAVLLRQAADDTWDIRVLVEAKASPDSVATDFPRLLRGLGMLARADSAQTYTFKAREGSFTLRGSTLRALPTDVEAAAATVLYSSDAPAEASPRLLSAAARMQLLSSPEVLAHAIAIAEGRPARMQRLESVWQQLLHAPRWRPLLNQYHTISQARALMVHVDDLKAAATAATA